MKLKVYHVNYDGKSFRLVAAHSKKEAAELCNLPLHYFNNYGSITANAEDMAIALKAPLTVFYRSSKYPHNQPWKPMESQAQRDVTN